MYDFKKIHTCDRAQFIAAVYVYFYLHKEQYTGAGIVKRAESGTG